MRISSVAALAFLLWLQAMPLPLEAGSKIYLSNWNTNETSPKFVKVISNNISKGSVVNVELDLLQDLSSLYVKFETYCNGNGKLRSIWKSPDYNMCNVLSLVNRKEMSLVKIIFSQLVKAVNRPASCPVQKGRVVFKNFDFDGYRLPSLFPPGLYYTYINAMTMENGVKIIILKIGIGFKVESL